MPTNRLHTVRYFLAQGPHYHFLYLRYKITRLARRLVTPRYDATLLPRPRSPAEFFFKAEDAPKIVAGLSSRTRRATLQEADRICDLEFSFRGFDTVRFDDEIDWHSAPAGNVDWRWDLNRHAWFETLGRAWHYTGERKYANTFSTCLSHWIDSNPVGPDGVNWSAPFEVAFRINSWTWAWHLFADCPHIPDKVRISFLETIGLHCDFLAANIERHARNNHLLLEAKSLLFGAVCFPQFEKAARWRRLAKRLLFREVRSQIYRDGVHNELSTHYHRVVAGELLELLILLRRNDDDLPADVEKSIRRMAEFECVVTRPDGTLPLFGDSTQEDTYARFPAAAAAPFWFSHFPGVVAGWRRHWESIAWRLPHADPNGLVESSIESRGFPQGGYYVLRTAPEARRSMYMLIDCGPFGSPTDPHHGHADALSFEAFALGRPWIVDSGVYSTHTEWRWRKYFRGTCSHNTVVVDGQDQSRLIDSRRADRLANSRCLKWNPDPSSEAPNFLGAHDGYRRLKPQVAHYRGVWFCHDAFWVICDLVDGAGQRTVESFLHSMPDVRIDQLGANTFDLADETDRVRVAVVSNASLTGDVISGSEDPVQGWHSENSGVLQPAPAIRLSAEAALPMLVCTLIAPDFDGSFDRDSVMIEVGDMEAARHAAISVRVGDEARELPFEIPRDLSK